MRTFFHAALIVVIGVVLGLSIRAFRRPPTTNGDSEIIYTAEATPDEIAAQKQAAVRDGKDENSVYQDPVPVYSPAAPPTDEEWLSKFELIERSGKTVKSEDLLGQPYIVSFFFSTCPSICVQQNQKLKELQEEFKGQGVRFVAISVDPETDTPERLREYATRFGASENQWLFMTGNLTYIRRVGAEIYQQPVKKKVHTERFILVDPDGKIEGMYSWPEPVQLKKLKKRIRELMPT